MRLSFGFENELFRDSFLMKWFICISVIILAWGFIIGNEILILLSCFSGIISVIGSAIIDEEVGKFIKERHILAVKSHFSAETANKGRFHGTKGSGKPAKRAKSGQKTGLKPRRSD